MICSIYCCLNRCFKEVRLFQKQENSAPKSSLKKWHIKLIPSGEITEFSKIAKTGVKLQIVSINLTIFAIHELYFESKLEAK